MEAADQIKQYESELAEVKELLKANPGDASLLSIKADMEELLSITRQQQQAAPAITSTPNVLEKALEAAVGTSVGIEKDTTVAASANANTMEDNSPSKRAADATATGVDSSEAPVEPPKKKMKKVKDFETPQHLVIHDTDSEAQKQRKKRETKKLKNKWRERKKEFETDRKKQSWQSFQKKKGKGKAKDKSMFSTHDSDAKVGVVRGER